MNERIIPFIRESCEKGYLEQKDWDVLKPLANRYNISQSELDKAIEEELKPIRQRRTDEMFASLNQPEAAINEQITFSAQSRRGFPDVLYMGEVKLELNPKMKAPAFVPIGGTCGLCVVHHGKADVANRILQNALMRIMFSLPTGWAKVTLVDPTTNFVNDFMDIPEFDEKLRDFIFDEKAVLSYFQKCFLDILDFSLKLGNKFKNLEAYNRANHRATRPFQLIVFPNIPYTMEDATREELTKIAKIAARTGVFFLFSVEAESMEEAKPVQDMFRTNSSSLCVMDCTGAKAKLSSHEPVDFFNNAFEFKVQTDLAFDANAIQDYNHEFDPEKYVVEKAAATINKGEEAIDALRLTLGVSEPKGKPYQLDLKQGPEAHVLAIVNDAKTREGIVSSIVADLTGKYTSSEELQAIAFNIPSVSKCFQESQVLAKTQSQETADLLRLLEKVEQIVSERKQIFASHNVTDYQAFRNKNIESMPRMACMFDLSSLEDKMMDYDGTTSVDVLVKLLSEAGSYGVHILLFWTPCEHLVLFDGLFGTKVLSSLSDSLLPEQNDFYKIGLMDLPVAEKEHQAQPGCALVVTKNSNVKIKIGTQK